MEPTSDHGVRDWRATVRSIITELAPTDIRELDLALGETRLRIVRQPKSAPGVIISGGGTPAATVPAGHIITSPLAGIFYRAPAPNADPYVRDGDEIENDQTIALIEAMKVFNEIRSDVVGKLVKFLAENGQLVQVGDALAEIAAAE